MELNEAIEVLKDLTKQVKVKSDGAYQTDKGMCACKKAISALEKQNPNKIKEYGICPECYYDFCSGMEEVNYCPNCGQRLEE